MAVRELIMSTIGISPPAEASREAEVGLSLNAAQGDEEGSCRSGTASPRTSSCDMENERLETPDREAGAASDMEDSARASGSQTDMEDDQGVRAEQQLVALEDAVCPAFREAKAWADLAEVEEAAHLPMNFDVAMTENNSDSLRCKPPIVTANLCKEATAECPQAVCGNDPKPTAVEWPKPQPPIVFPMHPRGSPHSPFAWSKVQNVPLDKMSRDHFMSTDGKTIEPEINSVQDNIAKLELAIVAKLMGRRISFPFLLEELKRRWSYVGEFEIITVGPNTVICIFQSSAARDAVLFSGPWIIAGNIIGMDRWDSSCSPNSLHGLRSPIWIRLPQLPLIYWDINNITRIANSLGEPLWMDSHTSKWGRSSFARICVKIDLSQKLLPSVWINGIHGRFFPTGGIRGTYKFLF
ncbi:hypothetical protein MA16_Dca028216 [Dendrobium catenatum]|uniref:DUF4283 domain-containing protein n=1 Tax=Dendrobium catenatum TaxID=906689 RepID=A0A2I0VCZ7_9ASPA|nr:hypothetical protein MA16_Dca028216 [Dendrobium catenatum]